MDLCAEDGVSGPWLLVTLVRSADASLADLKIFGPAGAGDPAPAPADPTRYTSRSHVKGCPASHS